MRINNNISALNTYRQYTNNSSAVGKSMEKLSSGLRINRAGDDAAGLAISEKMRAQINGIKMASKNSQDAISLVQTAEGALTETHSILQRMREIAVQSSSDTNESGVDRAALDAEFQQLSKEIDDIANKTTFNNMNLLNGDFASKRVSVSTTNVGNIAVLATKNTVGGTYAVSASNFVAARSATAGTATAAKGSTFASAAVATQPTITGASHDGAYTIAARTGSTLASATFDLKDANGDVVASTAAAGFDGSASAVNTLNFGSYGSVSFTNGGSAISTDSGMAAAFTGAGYTISGGLDAVTSPTVDLTVGSSTVTITKGKDKYEVDGMLLNTEAANLSDDDWASLDAIQTKLFGNAASAGTGTANKGGFNSASVTAEPTIKGANINGTYTIAVHAGSTAGSATFDLTDGDDNVVASTAAAAFDLAASATNTLDFGAYGTVSFTNGGSPLADFAAATTAMGTAGYTIAGGVNAGTGSITVSEQAAKPLTVQTGANKDDSLSINIDKMSAAYLGIGASDVKTQEASAEAIKSVDAAINSVSSQRASMGAIQNRLQHKINNLDTSAENLQAAESRIRDVDMAQEMVEFTKNNILQQAAQAMLAQANSQPQGVLQLLR